MRIVESEKAFDAAKNVLHLHLCAIRAVDLTHVPRHSVWHSV
jgi:hypothetical protein